MDSAQESDLAPFLVDLAFWDEATFNNKIIDKVDENSSLTPNPTTTENQEINVDDNSSLNPNPNQDDHRYTRDQMFWHGKYLTMSTEFDKKFSKWS